MKNRKRLIIIIAAVILLLAVIVGVVVAHGSSKSTSAAITPAPSASPSPTVTATPLATATPTPATPSPTPTPVPATTKCTTANLKLSLGPANNAAGTAYYNLIFTNFGGGSCTTAGFPGVSAVDGTGTQLGNPAQNSTSKPSTQLTLAAGGTAYATIALPNSGNYNPGVCSATSTSLKVYPPNDTGSALVSFAGSVCPGWTVTTLQAGSGQ